MATPNTMVLLALKSDLSISQECERLVRDTFSASSQQGVVFTNIM